MAPLAIGNSAINAARFSVELWMPYQFYGDSSTQWTEFNICRSLQEVNTIYATMGIILGLMKDFIELHMWLTFI